MLLHVQKAFAVDLDNYCKRPLILSSTTDWFPFIYKNENGESKGSDIEFLRYLLAKMGCELKVVHFPERRVLFELTYGEFDVGLGASFNEERAQDFLYTDNYRFEVNKFAFQSRDKALRESKSLQDIIQHNKIIAINLAGWYGSELENAKRDHNVFIYTDTADKRLKMLHHNRVNVVIDDEIVLCSELDRSNFNDIEIHPLVLFKTPIHFIFNKKTTSQAFIDKFNQELKRAKEDGSLSQYLTENLPSNCQL